jgi:hypothetical protein
MSRIETGTYAALTMQASFSVSGQDKLAGSRPSTGQSVKQPGSAKDATTIRMSADFAQLQNINDRQNQAASRIRSGDQKLQRTGRFLTQMKHMLFHIIKNYPPFEPGDKERVKYLKSFNGLRQQIEQLTIPPEKMWQDNIPGDSLPQAGINQEGSSSSASTAIVGAATTFGIPELPDMAPDVQIEATVHLIDKAQAVIDNRRATMDEQASSINQSVGYGAKAEELNRTYPDMWNLTLPADNTAEQKSIEAGSGLTQAPANSITTEAGMHSLLQSMAG